MTDSQPRDAASNRLDPLAGGGEMGRLMRSLDWSRTSVGPVDTWPQSLRTALSILLENSFPMYIAWGRDYTQFYNDGYRPILGSTKHPQALGGRASDTFAESWEIIRPMFDGVMQGNAVGSDNWMLPLDRYGFLEECYFNFSYSPIRDESGEVGGVLVTVYETTARVLGERRLHILQALASRTQEVTTIEAACAVTSQVLAESAAEIPFALLYLFEDEGATARLAGTAGLDELPIDSAQRVATNLLPPIADIARSNEPLLHESLDSDVLLLGDRGALGRAYVLPIAGSGDTRLAGVLVAGTSPKLAFDEKYRGFLELVASQIATALSSVHALQEARARAEALAEIDRAKTAFFSNVSHEFRTPLTLLLGPTEDALADPTPMRPVDSDRWQFVHRNGMRLLKLVNTLLDFSRIEAGRMQASYAETDLTASTRDLVSVFRAAIERAGITLSLDIQPLDHPVYIDRDMWEKVILNLLSNALKFTFEGTIAVSLRAVADQAVLTVRDTGIGIPAEELPYLFDRFHRVQGSRGRSQEGTGIGLALVRELVKLHGGTIDVESEVDRGTTFTVSIPFGADHLPKEHLASAPGVESTAIRAEAFVAEASRWQTKPGSPEDSTVSLATVSTEEAAALPRARVLLVDDNADMRDYVARLLRERWIVDTAADGASALAMAQENPPDLVLTDIMMPGLSGFELLQQLRSDARTRVIPVIFLSARAGEEARVEGLQAGADDYLAKPFSARELMARVSTHLELSRLRLAGERSRARMHSQFMQAPVAVSICVGRDLLFELANPRYEEMVGRTGLAGKTLREAFPELPDDAPVLRVLRNVYDTGETFQAEDFLVQLDRSGGGVLEELYFKFTSQALWNPDGTIEGIMTVAIDVTEQVLARRQLEHQAAELDRLNRAKDEFLATLSHELRTPLTSILGWARLLRMQARDEEMMRMGLESIDQSAQVQAQLIDDVLDLSRVTTGKVRVERAVVHVPQLASAALDGVRLAAAAKNIRLESSLPTGPNEASILGDSNRIQQILWNLLTNAIKFTPDGGRVTLTVEQTSTAVIVSVADTGVGIPENFQRHVFEPFRQADSSTTRSHGGLGLGLSIVRHLTEMHGGKVSVRSEGKGQGATFIVQFPLLRELPREPSALARDLAAELRGIETAAVSLTGVSILVIDDQESVCVFFMAALRQRGAAVRAATSVERGIAAVQKELPDVVLCDIAMPNQDGFAFLDWMRSHAETRNVPVLAITAFGRPEDEQLTMTAGFNGYVRKPVDPGELARAVAAVV